MVWLSKQAQNLGVCSTIDLGQSLRLSSSVSVYSYSRPKSRAAEFRNPNLLGSKPMQHSGNLVSYPECNICQRLAFLNFIRLLLNRSRSRSYSIDHPLGVETHIAKSPCLECMHSHKTHEILQSNVQERFVHWNIASITLLENCRVAPPLL